MLHCKECNSTDIGWDGWIDQNGEVINKFDFYMCLGCEEYCPDLLERKEEEEEEV